MNKILMTLIVVALLGGLAGHAFAADPPAETEQPTVGRPTGVLVQLGACAAAATFRCRRRSLPTD